MNKISIILGARNDNYGGNMLESLVHCLGTMSNNFEEIILVDFGSKIPLYNELKEKIQSNKIRIIEVPNKWVLAILKNDEHYPDVLARNIGIRRASNDIIVSSNIDIIPGPLSAFDFSEYDKNTFYTANKFHLNANWVQAFMKINNHEELQNILIKMQEALFRERIFTEAEDPIHYRWSKVSGCGDFQLAHRDIWFDEKIRGFEETMLKWGFADTNVQQKADLAGYVLKAAPMFPIFHIDHSIRGNSRTNDFEKDVIYFKKTTNNENWGFADTVFDERKL
jgi:hypothetical protein